MRILVTGGCGYIGSATARLLRAGGAEVAVIDDLSTGHRAAWDGPAAELDLRDGKAVAAFADGKQFDGVIHFAARAYVGESVEQPLRYWRANVVPVLNLCESLPGVPFVFSSSCVVYGLPQGERLVESQPQGPLNPYGNTKAAAERLLMDRAAAGLGPCAALRYFNAAGADPSGEHGEDHQPEPHLIPLAIAAAAGRAPALTVFGGDYDTPDGTCVRDYVHVEDLARAHLAALERLAGGGASGAWNLGTGTGSSVRQVLAAVELAVGRPVPHTMGPRRAGDAPRLVADASLAARELGWEPSWRDLGRIVESAARWHQNHPQGYGE